MVDLQNYSLLNCSFTYKTFEKNTILKTQYIEGTVNHKINLINNAKNVKSYLNYF